MRFTIHTIDMKQLKGRISDPLWILLSPYWMSHSCKYSWQSAATPTMDVYIMPANVTSEPRWCTHSVLTIYANATPKKHNAHRTTYCMPSMAAILCHLRRWHKLFDRCWKLSSLSLTVDRTRNLCRCDSQPSDTARRTTSCIPSMSANLCHHHRYHKNAISIFLGRGHWSCICLAQTHRSRVDGGNQGTGKQKLHRACNSKA